MGAVQVAGALRRDVSSSIKAGSIAVGDSLLAPSASMPVASSTLGGETFTWGGYIFAGGSHLLAGPELFKHYQRIYDPAVVWVGSQVTINGAPAANCQLITTGVIDGDPTASLYGVFTLGWAITNGLASGTGVTFSQGVTVVNGIVYVNSGYGIFQGMSGNVLLAFSVDGK